MFPGKERKRDNVGSEKSSYMQISSNSAFKITFKLSGNFELG